MFINNVPLRQKQDRYYKKYQKPFKCHVSFYFDRCLKIIKFWVMQFYFEDFLLRNW